MALALYMDVHVPAAITDELRRRGIDVLTSQEDGTRQTDDDELLTRATSLKRILVSQDDDFLKIAALWQMEGRSFFGVIYGHQQNTSIGRCIEDLELIANCYRADEMENQVVFLPLA